MSLSRPKVKQGGNSPIRSLKNDSHTQFPGLLIGQEARVHPGEGWMTA